MTHNYNILRFMYLQYRTKIDFVLLRMCYSLIINPNNLITNDTSYMLDCIKHDSLPYAYYIELRLICNIHLFMEEEMGWIDYEVFFNSLIEFTRFMYTIPGKDHLEKLKCILSDG